MDKNIAAIVLFLVFVNAAVTGRFSRRDLGDLASSNCRTAIRISNCSATCQLGLNSCYDTSSQDEADFENDGMCMVYNSSQPSIPGVTSYTLSSTICLFFLDHPQGTGLLFNLQDAQNYDVVFKFLQTDTTCKVGYAQAGIVYETAVFDCPPTVEENTHKYTVTVSSSGQAQATLRLQDGTETSFGPFATQYQLSTVGGVVMVNNGEYQYLEFTDISLDEVVKDFCASGPCANGGTCLEDQDGFICQCAPAYTGTLCETQLDPCLSEPCQNQGTCSDDGQDGFMCQCPPYYTGTLCENEIDPCQSQPCKNSGTCSRDGQGGFECQCPPSHTGTICETRTDPCASQPCQNQGTCSDDGQDGFQCQCPPYYTGPLCEVEIDPCQSQPCRNGGTCSRDGQGGFMCQCPPSHTGTICENPVDPCASQPCMNDGTCNTVGDGFACQCPPQFTGNLCQSQLTGCQSQPCMNDGTCSEVGDGFACQCPPAFTGTTCEIPLVGCESQPCRNGGTCSEVGNDEIACQCPPAYTGTLCESEIIHSRRRGRLHAQKKHSRHILPKA